MTTHGHFEYNLHQFTYKYLAWSKYGLDVLNITHTYRNGNTVNECLCVVCGVGANPVAHMMKCYLSQREVAKVKSLMNCNMTLTVLNLHQKTPKGATTKIQVKIIKRDIKITSLFSDKAISNTVIQ